MVTVTAAHQTLRIPAERGNCRRSGPIPFSFPSASTRTDSAFLRLWTPRNSWVWNSPKTWIYRSLLWKEYLDGTGLLEQVRPDRTWHTTNPTPGDLKDTLQMELLWVATGGSLQVGLGTRINETTNPQGQMLSKVPLQPCLGCGGMRSRSRLQIGQTRPCRHGAIQYGSNSQLRKLLALHQEATTLVAMEGMVSMICCVSTVGNLKVVH